MIYLHERQEKTKKWTGPRPGFPQPDWSMRKMMIEYLVARQLSYILAKDNGWFPAYYKNAPRIVIPCSNSAGIAYFQARDMTGKAKLRYASPPASRQDSIVVVWPGCALGSTIKGTVIVEGPCDALAAAEFGYLSIALMGNDPPEEVIQHIVATVKGKFEPVIVIPDLDHLEMGAAVVGALTMEGVKCEARLFGTQGGKDLADMTPRQRQEVLCA